MEVIAEDRIDDLEQAYQGKVRGIIQPPPEIRAIVDKTARFVAKNGKNFEQRILNSEEGRSAKFNFMRPHDPYNAYYEYKIREIEEGRDGTAAPTKLAVSTATFTAEPEKEVGKAAAEAVQRKAVMAPIAKAVKAIQGKQSTLDPFLFSHGHPTGLTAHDVDLIKLTAQYTAAGGKQFLATLARKEQSNEQFQFLKATHALFSYFTSLVDAYTKIIQPTEAQKAKVRAGMSTQVMLERAVHRWEYNRIEQEKRRAQEAEIDADKLAFRSIDWQDFVVVETIDFPEDELTGVSYGAADEDMDVEMDMEEDEVENSEDQKAEAVANVPDVQNDAELMAERRRAREAEDAGIKVVSDYKPIVASGTTASLSQIVIDPISGRSVPLSQLSEHMRIQLMDPRWREQQAVALNRQRETALAEGGSIADSLKAFARKRGDIFGSAEEEEAQMAIEAAERAKRMEEANRIIFNDRGNIPNTPQSAQPPPLPSPAKPAPTLVQPMSKSTSAPPLPPPPPRPAPALTPIISPMVMPSIPPMPQVIPLPTTIPMSVPFTQPASTSAPSSLIPEDEFADCHRGAVTIEVVCPTDLIGEAAAWNLNGQTVPITLPSVRSTIRELKELLSEHLGGMQPNKQQLRDSSKVFLKDSNTIAFYNLPNGAMLELIPRKRGGR